MQDCSNSIANALELLQSCTKPSISYLNSDPSYLATKVIIQTSERSSLMLWLLVIQAIVKHNTESNIGTAFHLLGIISTNQSLQNISMA